MIKKFVCYLRSVMTGNNYQGQCGSEGGEKLMEKVMTLFAAIKVKLEVIMNAMTKSIAIWFRKFIYVGVAIVTPHVIGE